VIQNRHPPKKIKMANHFVFNIFPVYMSCSRLSCAKYFCTLAMDDWKVFAMELWGLSVTTWTPLPERAGKLPEPLEYDTLHDGLVELETGQRHMVIQCISCYQVTP
jgi:hypothetical protein